MLCHSCPEGSFVCQAYQQCFTPLAAYISQPSLAAERLHTFWGRNYYSECASLLSYTGKLPSSSIIALKRFVWKPAQLKNWINQRQEESCEKFKTTLQKTLTVSIQWRMRKWQLGQGGLPPKSKLYPSLSPLQCCILPLMCVYHKLRCHGI